MTEDERKTIMAYPSAAVERISAGADGFLSRVVSAALALAPARASSQPSVRFRVSGHEFREADYRQISLWAKALETSPNKMVGTFKETTVDVTFMVDGGDVVQTGKIAFQVKDGSITSLA